MINAYVIDPTMDVFASASNSGVSSDVKQVDNITVSGSVAEGDVFTLNIGGIIDLELVSSTLTYTATEADEKSGVSAIASALKSLVDADANASGFVDTSTSSGVLTLTAKLTGNPFEATVSSSGDAGGCNFLCGDFFL